MNIKTLISINIDLNLNHTLDDAFHWCIKFAMAFRDLIFRTKRLHSFLEEALKAYTSNRYAIGSFQPNNISTSDLNRITAVNYWTEEIK